ncbi:MAG: alpha/beta hydrolase [Anaerolineae bacterium]|nr:alpha/beta hydrolase [Anaerolineae bacterium]MDQ7036591.1 alpha/beta hydrolase [Anaerolineae bacterium]
MSDALALRVEAHQLTTRDKTKIHAVLYRPFDHQQRAVLIAPAIGFKQSFYQHYANYLAEQGFLVLTIDYRGIGASLQRRLWGYEANLGDWGGQDMQAAITWLKRHYPTHQLTVVGHSIAAMLLGLAQSNTSVDAFLGIAPPHVYWGNWSRRKKAMLLAFWYGLVPISTIAMGYFPAPIFKLGERLPKGVALDWARAGRNPQALRGVYADSEYHHFDTFTGVMLCYSFDDDSLAPRKSVANLLSLYPNAQSKHHQHIMPADVKQTKIGHHGFFHPRMRHSLWSQTTSWLMNPQAPTVEQVVPDTLSANLETNEFPV